MQILWEIITRVVANACIPVALEQHEDVMCVILNGGVFYCKPGIRALATTRDLSNRNVNMGPCVQKGVKQNLFSRDI
jgi:hypothetical protein